MPTTDEPVCPMRQGLATFLVIIAPPNFAFLPTCGYWVLARIGTRYNGLPPGSLCRNDPDRRNIANVQLALSLEQGLIYEFTLQVTNALSVGIRPATKAS